MFPWLHFCGHSGQVGREIIELGGETGGGKGGERVLVYSRRSLFGFLTAVGWWGLGVRVQGVLIGWFYLISVSFSDFSSSQMKSIHVSFGNGLLSVGFYPQLFSGR